VLIILGLAGYAIALPGLTVNGVTFDVHTLLYSSVAIIAGQQAISFALFTKGFAIGEGLLPLDRRTERFFRIATLERGIALGALLMSAGLVLLADVALTWHASGWGSLDYAHTMRRAVPGATLTMLGLHTVFASFFVSILGLRRR
jgi:hypothetical protein